MSGREAVVPRPTSGRRWLLIQLVGILFVVPAVTVVLLTLEGTDGAGWARLCLPLISVAAALACAQTLIGGSRANLVEAASTESAYAGGVPGRVRRHERRRPSSSTSAGSWRSAWRSS